MSHFHVCTGPQGSVPLTDVMFGTYEDSLECFVHLSNALFKNLRRNDYDLTIEQAQEATGNGNNSGAYVGVPGLSVFWVRCNEDTHTTSAWN